MGTRFRLFHTGFQWNKADLGRVQISGSCQSAKKHKHQRRKRQSVTAKWEKSQTPKFVTALLTLPNLT